MHFFLQKNIIYNVFVNNLIKLLSKRKGMFLSNFSNLPIKNLDNTFQTQNEKT